MHLKRWITALIALPLFILLIFKGGSLLFTLFIAAVASITLWEYFRIVFHGHSPEVPLPFLIFAYLISTVMILTVQSQGFKIVAALLVVNLIGVAVMSIFRFKTSQDAPVVAAKQAFGVLYIAFFLSFAVLLYNSAHGAHLLFMVFVVVAAGDTGAYYVGTYLGRNKLCPAVSPKKTIEGSIGGLVVGLVLGTAYKLLFLPSISLAACVLFALIVGVVGQIGDLFESLFKRVSGIKDSGTLLPGHGGFFDRIDALLFALPTAYLLKEYVL